MIILWLLVYVHRYWILGEVTGIGIFYLVHLGRGRAHARGRYILMIDVCHLGRHGVGTLVVCRGRGRLVENHLYGERARARAPGLGHGEVMASVY